MTHDLLLQCKDIVVEELMELLVRVVNAQLLKGVPLQVTTIFSMNC